MKRFRWLWVVMALVALPGLVIVVEHFRGRAALARTMAELAANGEVLDPRRFLPPPVPAQSNGLTALVAAMTRLGSTFTIEPPSLRMVATGVAVPGTRMDRWDVPGQGPPQSWAMVEGWLQEHTRELADLRSSLTFPVRQAVVDPSGGFTRMNLSHLSKFKAAAKALEISAAAAGHRGDFEAAMINLESIRIMEADLAREPVLINQLVALACGAIANNCAWSVLHAREWNAAQLERLQRFMTEVDLVKPMLRSLEFERAVALHEFRTSSNAELSQMLLLDYSQMLGGGPAPMRMPDTLDDAVETMGEFFQRLRGQVRDGALFPLWRYGWGDHATAYYARAMTALMTAQREAARQGHLAAAPESGMQRWITPASFYDRWCAAYVGEALPALARSTTKAFRNQTERALHGTGIAITRYQRRQGRLPDSLAALVPDFLAALPRDYMDGKPLRYRRDSETEFTLWSVADDLIDDGGRKPWSQARGTFPSGNWWKEDGVWPRCASAGQIAAAQQLQTPSIVPLKIDPSLAKRYGLTLPIPPAAATNPPGR